MYFTECEHCGAALDPGEKCTCIQEREEQTQKLLKIMKIETDKQYKLVV